MKQHLIAPSLLAADFRRLDQAIELVNNSQADWFHLDVMDGHFVPNISFGMSIVEQIGKDAQKPMDVHLMIDNPDQYLEAFARTGAFSISVHVEACPHLHRTVQAIKELGCKAGVALNPHTPVSMLEHIIEDIDIALIMTVNPGFGGQKFIYQSIPKLRKCKHLIETRNANCLIQVDGGIGLHNAQEVLKAGADVLVAGSSVFKADNPTVAIEKLKSIQSNPISFA
ncbi:MAG: ribulose-phosphate 3-epimerase [Bacteroidota bacterium]